MLRIPITAMRGLERQCVQQHGNLARMQRVIGKTLLHGNLRNDPPRGVAPSIAKPMRSECCLPGEERARRALSVICAAMLQDSGW